MSSKLQITAVVLSSAAFAGCTTTSLNNAAGSGTVYENSATGGAIQGVGIESQDIVSMADRMMRDLLADPLFSAPSASPPRIIIDAEFFDNESTSRVNVNSLTDRLRISLNRAAKGRILFVARHASTMVQQERQLKRDGQVDGGTIRRTDAVAGADYRLAGRITSQDARTRDGRISRWTQVSFEMVDLEYQTAVWGNLYDFRKSAQDDVVYR